MAAVIITTTISHRVSAPVIQTAEQHARKGYRRNQNRQGRTLVTKTVSPILADAGKDTPTEGRAPCEHQWRSTFQQRRHRVRAWATWNCRRAKRPCACLSALTPGHQLETERDRDRLLPCTG